ncbi:2,3-bisphosphoglycerate-independent phosphoglycerate mutase 1 [Choanephora cucurbitarum]|uniref:2,3-bisphosphoglycerate-independent phosphoglycerate mutase 1 n=1 Tax=Choanephora cucurbitarum TaxID=101091 RepID=A0A1C7N355_9FUNG|nr:2,3-bisphosphoglycerate-independent phosphoglycerate mutase 1 [Choanephora cucurbitarum]
MKNKLLIFLIDGLGDVNLPDHKMKTPLQLAHLPFLDELAASGLNGLLDPVEPGLACGSDTAHLSILGYDPRVYYEGRGAFESMGAGLEMIPGDIAFKCNFAYLDETSGTVVLRKADKHFEGIGPVLCHYLDNIKLPSFPEHCVSVKYAIEHRCGIRVRGPGLASTITGTDPLKDNKKLIYCTPTIDNESSIMTSKLTNELSDELIKALKKHPINQERIRSGKTPANCVLLRGCGSCIDVPSIQEKHKLKSFLIAPTCIIAGIGMTVGMDLIDVPGATGDYSTDFNAKGKACLHHIQSDKYDFGFCHLKAVDDAGHDRNVEKKIYYMQKIDAMIGSVVSQLRSDPGDTQYTIIVTGDHTTPVLYGDHSCEPVPFLISSVNKSMKNGDSVTCFNEIDAAQGALGRFCGDQVMPLAKAFMKQ